MILADRMWKKLPTNHPAVVQQMSENDDVGTHFGSIEGRISNV